MAGPLHIKKRTKVSYWISFWYYTPHRYKLFIHQIYEGAISLSFYMSSCVDIACPLKGNGHIELCSWSTQSQTRNHYRIVSRATPSRLIIHGQSVDSESVILQGTIRLNAESQIVSLTIFQDLIQSQLFVYPSATFCLNMWNLHCLLIIGNET